jgi:hypothetical protein
MAKKLKEQ